VVIEGSGADAKTLKNGLWRAERGGKEADGNRGQHGTFSEMEHARVLPDEDDDGIAMFLFSVRAGQYSVQNPGAAVRDGTAA